ncbi:MAG: PH domain-containing protein [Methanoregulaceae archaeon]|nr:PH domain-containing protein [Methanoregulaceae archaeon]
MSESREAGAKQPTGGFPRGNPPGDWEFRPSPRLRLLYMVYLLVLVWGGIFWWLIPMILAEKSPIALEITVIVLLSIVFAIVWIRRYWQSMTYRFTKDALTFERGVLFRKIAVIPYETITEVRVVQGPVSRLFGLSTLLILSGGLVGDKEGTGEIPVRGVIKSWEMRDRILGMSDRFSGIK